MKEHLFIVKLDMWTNPVKIMAKSALDARNKALKEFPTCDCCNEPVKVEYVNYLESIVQL